MKLNKWTVGLAAVGVVSLASATTAKADEAKMSALQTALSSTTISGYVDTSMQWNVGTGNAVVAPVSFQNSTKADGFNLNVVDLAIDKPEDDSPWASGYHIELWLGPDANTLATDSNPFSNPTAGGIYSYSYHGEGEYYSYTEGNQGASDFAIRQAYVVLRTPVGNGIDWKIGVFDSPLGYESTSSPSNPNYTHSYGYTIEPTELTGVTATYKVNDEISLQAGIADVAGPMINERAFIVYEGEEYNYPTKAESYKTYFGAITLTAPQNWGWANGSTVTAGVLNGYSTSVAEYGGTQTSWYVGGTLSTPVTGLKVGAAFDYLNAGNTSDDFTFNGEYDYDTWAAAFYANYQYNDKLSFNGRYDYWNAQNKNYLGETFDSVTADVQYNLWANVISRVEARWDHAEHGVWFGGTDPYYDNDDGYGEVGYPWYSEYDPANARENAFMLALQIIYQF